MSVAIHQVISPHSSTTTSPVPLASISTSSHCSYESTTLARCNNKLSASHLILDSHRMVIISFLRASLPVGTHPCIAPRYIQANT